MVKEYKKGERTQITEHFSSTEFDCRCTRPGCVVTLVCDELAKGLEVLRAFVGPAQVLSGFRCEEHNSEEGGVRHSQHVLGKAADIRPENNLSPHLVAEYADRIAAFANGGIGVYRMKNFTHLDSRDGRARWAFPLGC